MGRFANRLLAKAFTRFPALAERWATTYRAVGEAGIPWTQLAKPLRDCSIALVTTAGVHLRAQTPFDMHDADGDPSYRVIPRDTPRTELTITHDYYDHRDADRDLNVVLPMDRLAELAEAGEIGAVAPRHFGFMGHIDKQHVRTLRERTAPEVARILRADAVDAVVLTPA